MSDSPDRSPRENDRRPGNGRPTGPRGDSSRPYKGKPPASGRPSRDGRPPTPREGEKRLWTKAGAPARGDRDSRERETPEDRDPFGTRSVRSRHDDPIIPEGVTADELDRKIGRASCRE